MLIIAQELVIDLKTKMPKKYLTVREVARLIGVTPLTVRNWDKKGVLQAYRNPVNNYRLYLVEDVENLLKSIETSKPTIKKIDVTEE